MLNKNYNKRHSRNINNYPQTKKNIPIQSKIPTSSLPQHPQPLSPHIQPPSSYSPISQTGSVGGGVGFLSNFAGSVMQGMTLGAGSQLASRTLDNIMGPREIHLKNVENDKCINEKNLYNECVKNAGSDISPCKNYMEMINECNNLKN